MPNFALFLQDNVHNPRAKPASPLAGKTLAYLAGSLKDEFFTNGLHYDPKKVYLLANAENMDEDEALAWRMTGRINRKNICEDDGDDDTDDTDTDDENTNTNSTVPIEPNNSMSKNGGKGKKNRTN